MPALISPRARPPRPARAAGHRHRHLSPHADLSLRHPGRPAAGRPRAGAATPTRHIRRPPAGATRRALHGHPGSRLDLHHRPGRAAVPADVRSAARERGAAVVAQLPAYRDDRLARAARRRPAQHRSAGSRHARSRCHPWSPHGPRRHRRHHPHRPGLPRLPRRGRAPSSGLPLNHLPLPEASSPGESTFERSPRPRWPPTRERVGVRRRRRVR